MTIFRIVALGFGGNNVKASPINDHIIKNNIQSDVTNRALANNTDWCTDKTRDYKSITYYPVATNELVAMTYVI